MFTSPTFPTTTTAFGGQTAAGGSLFGGAKPTGSSIFGTTPASQPPASGTLFGAQQSNTGLFGQQKPAFGQTTTQPSFFGQPQQQPSSTGMFGAATSTGTTTTSLFGQPAQPTTAFGFGQQQPQQQQQQAAGGGLFGATKPATQFGFGAAQTGTSAFGGTTGTQGNGLFGVAQTNVGTGNIFGGQQQATGGLFGQQQQQPGTAGTKFVAPGGDDIMQLKGNPTKVTTKHMCISAMKEYEHKSLEELRTEDYMAGRTKNSGALPASGTSMSLFGQPQQQQSLFGTKPAGSSLFGTTSAAAPFPATTAAATSMFGQPAATTTGGLFNKPTAFATGAATQAAPTGNMFQTGTSSLFPQKQATGFGQTTNQLFGQTTAGTGSIFGGGTSAPAFGVTTTTASNMFGQPAQQAPAFGFTQPATGATGIFGQTKTAFGAFSTPQQTGQSAFGVPVAQTTTNMFGAQPAKPAIFGVQPQQTATGVLFGGQSTAPTGTGLFGAGAPQTGFGTVGASPPIMLGTNVNVSSIQQAIIDAQLSTLPYGDSPLLKSPSPRKTDHDIGSLQRQLHLSNKRNAEEKDASVLSGSSFTTPFSATGQQDASKTSADLNGSLLDGSFTYKPLALLPSVGFGTSLGLYQSPKLRTGGDSFLSKTKTTPNDDKNVKSLDMSIVFESLEPSKQPQEHRDRIEAVQLNGVLPTPPRLDLSETPERRRESISDFITQPTMTPDNSQLRQPSPRPTEVPPPPPAKQYRVKLLRPEYYCEPSVEELEDQFEGGVCRIESGLTIGRLGYGSVFWKGPVELEEPVNLDEIVHFRNKEVVIYPDDAKKPEVGTGLNKTAEVSLERVWPIEPKTKQAIKDADELRRLGFREKLDRLCQRMDAVFRDYQPATGTWQFEVQHFSKYGFLDEEEEDQSMDTSSEEVIILAKQAHMQTLVQKAKVPLREIQKTLEGTKDVAAASAKRTIEIDENEDSKIEEMLATDDSKLLQEGHLQNKKFKFDDTLFESSKLLSHLMEKDAAADVKRRYQLVKRSPKNANKNLASQLPTGLLLSRLGFGSALPYRGARSGFARDLAFTSLTPGCQMSAVNIQRLTVIPTIKNYFLAYLKAHVSPNEHPSLHSFESELVHFDPPSSLLNLLDTFITQSYRDGQQEGIQAALEGLCAILLMKTTSAKDKIAQRIQMGHWISRLLHKRKAGNKSATVFGRVFNHLVCGSPQMAVAVASKAQHYNLALFISLYKCPNAKLIRDQVGKQLFSTSKRSMEEDYAKILELLSGQWSASESGCLNGLDWLQILGALIWYHASPSTTVLDCIDQLEDLLK